jgi:hypothetical protein
MDPLPPKRAANQRIEPMRGARSASCCIRASGARSSSWLIRNVVRAEDAKKAAVRVALTIVGKILGLLGAFTLVAAFGALASNDSASRRMLHFVWILIVGASLLAAGLWRMKKGKRQV